MSPCRFLFAFYTEQHFRTCSGTFQHSSVKTLEMLLCRTDELGIDNQSTNISVRTWDDCRTCKEVTSVRWRFKLTVGKRELWFNHCNQDETISICRRYIINKVGRVIRICATVCLRHQITKNLKSHFSCVESCLSKKLRPSRCGPRTCIHIIEN